MKEELTKYKFKHFLVDINVDQALTGYKLDEIIDNFFEKHNIIQNYEDAKKYSRVIEGKLWIETLFAESFAFAKLRNEIQSLAESEVLITSVQLTKLLEK